ncbi:MAG: bifunctional DNA primase/polymerase, partial [Nitrospirales bacterium]
MTDDEKAYMAEALEWALRYAEMGFDVFPCHAPLGDGCTCEDPACTDIGKHPRTPNGFKNASKDKAQVEKWFGPKAKLSNVAIRTGKESGLTVIDIDDGPEKVGMQTWGTMTNEHGEPPTLISNTGGGGVHVFFQYNERMGTSRTNYFGKKYKHVDLRSDAGYIIGPPSLHKSGERYAWGNWGEALAAVPQHLIPKDEKNKPRSPGNDDPGLSLDEVKAMLKAIPPDDRDTWFKVGIILGDTFPDDDEAYAAYHEWADTWGGTKGPKHDQTMHDCFYVLSKQEVPRKLTLGTLVKWARDAGWVPASVTEMNTLYAVVWMGGDCVILREHPAPDTGLLDVSFCTKNALTLFHAADAKVGKVEKVQYWLRHPDHRSYDAVVFQPGPTPCDPRFYNFWRGFPVEPRKGDCSLYLAHLLDNIACGNEDHFRYLMAWMANIVQTPGTRPGVAIVLRGKQGTGKGVFAKGFGNLFKPHFAQITNSHQLVGRFNALLKKAVVVFADEAFWAGSKDAEGTLNALITEETHNIEPKGIDPFSVRNFMHLIVASNHDWVIPAASEARRWFVLDVSEAHL